MTTVGTRRANLVRLILEKPYHHMGTAKEDPSREDVPTLPELLEDPGWCDENLRPNRYLVLLLVEYRGQPDDVEFDMADDLTVAGCLVAEHTREPEPEGYDYSAHVFDLDTGAEVPWERETKIVFKKEGKE